MQQPRVICKSTNLLLCLCCWYTAPCSYLWSDVMSADGFMAFVEAGTSNDADVRRLGQHFRNTFLSLGGSVAPAEVYKRFRGHEPQLQSVVEYNKLNKIQS